MAPGTPILHVLHKLVSDILRAWIKRCLRYATRPFDLLYSLLGAIVKRLSRGPPQHPDSQRRPRIKPTSDDTIAVSQVPRSLVYDNPQDDIRDDTPSVQDVQPRPATPPRMRPSLRNPSSPLDQSRQTGGSMILSSDDLVSSPIVSSPVERRNTGTVTFNESELTQRVQTPSGCLDSDSSTCSLETFYPDESERYDRQIDVPTKPEKPEMLEVQPLQKPRRKTMCEHDDSWSAHAQPEGQLYFSKLSGIMTTSGPLRVYTEAHMHDSSVCSTINHYLDILEDKARYAPSPLTYTEAVLEIRDQRDSEENAKKCHYYLVDPKNRTIGWFDKFDGSCFAELVSGLPSAEYLHHYFEKQYWSHVERFPHFQEFDDDSFDELTGMTLYSAIDSSTSRDSTSASHYSADELQQLCAFTKNLRALARSNKAFMSDPQSDLKAYVVSCIGRLHSIFAHNRFYHLCGHYGARLTYDQSIRGKKKRTRSWIIKIMSPLLFQASNRRLADLEKIYTDELVSKVPWKTFIEGMMRDWEQFVINAAVLLNANVAFLDLPGISPSQADEGDVSPSLSIAQSASQLSMVTSIGSMIIGLLLVRQHRTKPIDTAHEAANYLSSHSEGRGLEYLAIEFSLPYALLMWGMLTFLVAIAFNCFGPFGFEVTIPEYAIFSLSWAIVAALILWTVIINLETTTTFRVSGLFDVRAMVANIRDTDWKDTAYWRQRAKMLISGSHTRTDPRRQQNDEEPSGDPSGTAIRKRRLPMRAFTVGRRRVTDPEG